MKLSWLVPCALAALLYAVPAAAQDAGEDRATAFQAVEGAVQEDVPGGPLLVVAYGLVWLGVFAYLVRLVRLQSGTEREVTRLEGMLGRANADDTGAPPA